MSKSPRLFDEPLKPRQAPRKLMHVIDAGEADGAGDIVRFGCARCGHESGWMTVSGVTEGKRGIPCPKCNKAEGQ